MAHFLKSLPKTHGLTGFWRCSQKLFLLACQAVSDVLMQVSSQTCSCTEKGSPGEEGWGDKPRISSLLSYLPTQPVEKHAGTALSDKAKLSWHLSPSTAERGVCPPIYTSVWSPTHTTQRQQPWARLIGQLSKWSELLIISEAADSSSLTVAQTTHLSCAW